MPTLPPNRSARALSSAYRSDLASGASITLHATAVAFGASGLLITGRSGSGKSNLAVELMAFGAMLVADDRVICASLAEGGLHLSSPPALKGRIEARSFGILSAQPTTAIAAGVVDLDRVETNRLPDPQQIVIAGVPLRLISKVESRAFAAMLHLTFSGTCGIS